MSWFPSIWELVSVVSYFCDYYEPIDLNIFGIKVM